MMGVVRRGQTLNVSGGRKQEFLTEWLWSEKERALSDHAGFEQPARWSCH